MRTLITSIAAAAILTCGLGSTAIAGDCQQVRFQFWNKTGAKVKVKKIHIKGNDGSWNEDIANLVIKDGQNHSTSQRRLNKLDSGKKGDFTVRYDRWHAPDNAWKPVSQTFKGLSCEDGKLFSLELTKTKSQ